MKALRLGIEMAVDLATGVEISIELGSQNVSL